jgi:hypothetical protein
MIKIIYISKLIHLNDLRFKPGLGLLLYDLIIGLRRWDSILEHEV